LADKKAGVVILPMERAIELTHVVGQAGNDPVMGLLVLRSNHRAFIE
jgi:hypothetical protein